MGPILIVDDEPDLVRLLDLHLRRENFATVTASTAEEALAAVAAQRPSLVLLDLMLPDRPGTEVVRRMRGDMEMKDVPIIILSARGEEIDRVVGFEVGADDYVVKSNLSMRELVLRVRAVLRRRGTSVPPVPEVVEGERIRIGELVIDPAAHRVWVSGEDIPLTATEFKLLLVLVQREGRVQSRGVLLQLVWDMPPDLNTRTVDTHVKRLRRRLGVAAAYLETVRGFGYRFSRTPTE